MYKDYRPEHRHLFHIPLTSHDKSLILFRMLTIRHHPFLLRKNSESLFLGMEPNTSQNLYQVFINLMSF